MKLKSKIKFADEKVKQSFEQLKNQTEENWLYQSLIKAFNELEFNAFIGLQIQKSKIPKIYFKKYGINNCWKMNLPNGWRLIYSIGRDDVIVLSIVLEWFNHKEYEKRFAYN